MRVVDGAVVVVFMDIPAVFGQYKLGSRNEAYQKYAVLMCEVFETQLRKNPLPCSFYHHLNLCF